MIIYAVILYFGDKVHELLFSLVALSMIRGITLFRLFYNTRYMISLLSQVLKSLTAFSCVLIYSTISFALLSKTVGDDESQHAFLHQISHVYALQIGAFEVNDDWDALRWIIFISATIIELIIMMNLLISLLGDTYSRVQESAEIEDLKQLIEIILEVENLFIWNKSKSGKQYIQICDTFRFPDTGDILVKKITKIKKLNLQMINVAKSLSTPINIQSIVNQVEKTLSNNARMNKEEILNKLDEIATKINEASSAKCLDELDDKEYIPVCPKGHLLEDIPRTAICDLCRGLVTEHSMCCTICWFDMCRGCIDWIKRTKPIKESQCLKGHELRESAVVDINPKDMEIYPHICRCCNQENTFERINYCRYCTYSLCIDCRSTIVKSTTILGKFKCDCWHDLKWIINYRGCTQIIFKCTVCESKYLGAGFFTCNICPYYICLKCFRNKYF